MLLFICLAFSLCGSCASPAPYTRISGFVEGTTYAITYEGADTLKAEIEALLARFDNSLSVYNSASIISKVNRNEAVELDSFFVTCFSLAQKISKASNGAFDISAAPLFQVWGFGSQKISDIPSKAQVDSLKAFCGMDKIRIENNRIVKTDPRVSLNANAIAKGYSADVVAHFLESRGKRSYLVEIGGEIFCRGINQRGSPWIIGIDRPTDGNYTPGADVQAKLKLSGKGLATSGNYRKFFVINGQKYAHTINPATGYPSHNNLLSASVVAPTCGEADAYATVLMVVGLDSAKRMLQLHPELDALLIYAEGVEFKTYATPGFARNMVQ